MTKKAAQEKIRNHLDRRSNHTVDVTEHMVLYWWRICNVAIFNKKLYPPSEILIKRMKDWGYCTALTRDEVQIALNEELTTRGMFLSTLIHEMVHQWENQTYGQMGHGKRFFTWKERVHKSLGLDIHVEADEEDYTYGKKQLYKRRY